MKPLTEWTQENLNEALIGWRKEYEDYKVQGLKLDMSRGKPCPEQLDLTLDMLNCLDPRDGFADHGFDLRNYGILEGIPAARQLFGDILGVPAEQVIVGGNSSLNMMFDYIASAVASGVCGGQPWGKLEKVKFLCPSPGYDRHFRITEHFGMELITVPMTATGPDMDVVEQLVKDNTVKGIWCVPMYSNPSGITYSDETVRRLAALRPMAKDFRIMWDNAYCMHHLYPEHDRLLNIYEEALACGNEDLVIQFTSTSKISFAGAGVAAMAASPRNLDDIRKRLSTQTIGYDKLNMLRHVRYFKDVHGVEKHMEKHADLLRPKFEVVLDVLNKELRDTGIATWHQPRGGYFISVDLMSGCAKRTVQLLSEAGVVMTGAGATYPYGVDPSDSNLRVAPSYPSCEELETAFRLFCLCARIAAAEKLLA